MLPCVLQRHFLQAILPLPVCLSAGPALFIFLKVTESASGAQTGAEVFWLQTRPQQQMTSTLFSTVIMFINKYWRFFGACSSIHAILQIILNSPSSSKHLLASTDHIFLFFFFNSSYSEKETLETISNEDPGIHEAWVEACEWFAVREPPP